MKLLPNVLVVAKWRDGVVRLLMLCLFFALQMDAFAVDVETTDHLNVYYPEFTKMDLVCGQMPKPTQKDVEFCCEAAFTGELLLKFKHQNIADNHICNGVMQKGYRCKANSGAFVWGKGKWKFMRKANFPTEAGGWNMGFCQLLIVYNGSARPISEKMRPRKSIYRALCEKGGRLCIIEAKKAMKYETFVQQLTNYKVTHALYLDMGMGWNYAWYRDKAGEVKEIFAESKWVPNYVFRTNWVTFYH
jgi:hypothetical protein